MSKSIEDLRADGYGQIDSLVKLMDVVIPTLGEGVERDKKTLIRLEKGVYLYYLIKYRRSLLAIKTLVEGGFYLDATIIARTLFEILLAVKYLCDEPDKKTALDKWYAYDAVTKAKKLNLLSDIHNQPDKFIRFAEKREKDFSGFVGDVMGDREHYRSEYGESYVRKNWMGLDLAQLAKKLDLGGSYATFYQLSSDLVHNGIGAVNLYVEEGQVGLQEKSEEEDGVAVFSALSFGINIIEQLKNRGFVDKIATKKFERIAKKFLSIWGEIIKQGG